MAVEWEPPGLAPQPPTHPTGSDPNRAAPAPSAMPRQPPAVANRSMGVISNKKEALGPDPTPRAA